MNDLVKYIEEKNVKTAAWVEEDPDYRWAGMITTDVDHWAEYGITTVEQYKKYMLAETIADASKSAYGSKYRVDWENETLEDLEKLADSYCDAANREYEAEKAREEEEVRKFEGFIQTMLNEWGVADRETAIRWLLEAENMNEVDFMYGGEYACYKMNLPYTYQKEFDKVMATMTPKEKSA